MKKQVWGIAVHGGAGKIRKCEENDILMKIRTLVMISLKEVIKHGCCMLSKGKSAMDTCEEVVRLMEDSGLFNCGKGAVHIASTDGVEQDATIMCGMEKKSGAVGAVPNLKNAICLARKILENKEPSTRLLCGVEALEFASKFGIQEEEEEYFQKRPRSLKARHELYGERFKEFKEGIEKYGTVGCVVRDVQGNVAAATSTGGLSRKLPGRVGDSGIVGAGTYADNDTCAVSCTGIGEMIIDKMVAYDLSARMRYKRISLEEASNEVLKNLEKDTGGFVAIDKDCNIAMPFNSLGMYRGCCKSGGKMKLFIWKEEFPKQ